MAPDEADGAHQGPKSSNTQVKKLDTDIDAALVALADGVRSHDMVSFSRKELMVLEAYDQLKDLELSKAVLQARSNLANEPLPALTEATKSRVKELQKGLLEARASYHLRESVIDNVIQADPVLKSVHSGPNASHNERTLHPLIDERDILAMSQANLSSALQNVQNAISTDQAENVKAQRRNRELAATLISLASALKGTELSSVDDTTLRETLDSRQTEVKESKKRFRYIKGLASGVIAGSGVEWANDDNLREIVLDDED